MHCKLCGIDRHAAWRDLHCQWPCREGLLGSMCGWQPVAGLEHEGGDGDTRGSSEVPAAGSRFLILWHCLKQSLRNIRRGCVEARRLRLQVGSPTFSWLCPIAYVGESWSCPRPVCSSVYCGLCTVHTTNMGSCRKLYTEACNIYICAFQNKSSGLDRGEIYRHTRKCASAITDQVARGAACGMLSHAWTDPYEPPVRARPTTRTPMSHHVP